MKYRVFPAAGLAIALAATGVVTATTRSSGGFTGHQFARMARISLDQARAAALKARPGAITDQELEKEAGGSGLRYSFDIKNAGTTYEVGVDAKTGSVLENDRDNGND